jgi:hypothetical protein
MGYLVKGSRYSLCLSYQNIQFPDPVFRKKELNFILSLHSSIRMDRKLK